MARPFTALGLGLVAFLAMSCDKIVGITAWRSSGGAGGAAPASSSSATSSTETATATATTTTTTTTTSSATSTTQTATSSSTGSGCSQANSPIITGGVTGGTPTAAQMFDLPLPPQPTVKVGDVVLATIWRSSAAPTITPPDASWTQVGTRTIPDQTNTSWFFHRLVSTDGSTFVFSATSPVVWRSSTYTYFGVASVQMGGLNAVPAEPAILLESAGSYQLPVVTTMCPNMTLLDTGSFSPDPGIPVTWSETPNIYFPGYGNGMVGFEVPAKMPGTSEAVTVTSMPAGLGSLTLSSFVLSP